MIGEGAYGPLVNANTITVSMVAANSEPTLYGWARILFNSSSVSISPCPPHAPPAN